MKSKKTNAKRQVVSHTVQPVVRCDSCRYWDKDCCLSDEMGCGVCRRYPPMTSGKGDWDLQSQTREDDWCGEYVSSTSNPGLQGTGHLVDRTLQGVVRREDSE